MFWSEFFKVRVYSFHGTVNADKTLIINKIPIKSQRGFINLQDFFQRLFSGKEITIAEYGYVPEIPLIHPVPHQKPANNAG